MSFKPVQSLDAMNRNKQGNVKKGNQFYVHPADLVEEDGFNPRDYDQPDTVAHIDALAAAYMRGDYVPPIIVQVVDSRVVVRDGHCRRRAMLKAIEQGADLGQQPVMGFAGDADEADLLVLTTQSGKKLTAVELGVMFSRMRNRGKSESEIAERVGCSPTHVKNILEVHSMPIEIKDLITAGRVSYSLALETFQELGTKAVEVLEQGVEEVLVASGGAKTKLTRKRLDQVGSAKPKPKPVGKKVVTRMVTQVRALGSRIDAAQVSEDGSATLKLTAEELAALRELRDALPEEEAPEEDGAGDQANQRGLAFEDNDSEQTPANAPAAV